MAKPGNQYALKHGLSFSKEYKAWQSMKDRCYLSNHPSYRRHGARGIKVCDEWRQNFQNFYKDMGPAPSGTSLDRINNDGNYEPSNCRWATSKQQNRNRHNSRPSWHYDEIEKIAGERKISFSSAAERFDKQRGFPRGRKKE